MANEKYVSLLGPIGPKNQQRVNTLVTSVERDSIESRWSSFNRQKNDARKCKRTQARHKEYNSAWL